MPAFIDRPDPFFAPIEEWIEYHADLDVLDARLRVMFPALDWLAAMQALKAEADEAILSRLSPADRNLVERLMAHHPTLTAAKAISDLTRSGGP